MREGKFIDKNVSRWQSYMEASSDPDVQADRFINLIDDLGYAKTHYGEQSKTTRFINAIAAKQFQGIYTHRKLDVERLITFWKYELPLIFAKYQKVYLFTLFFFILSVLVGVVSSMQDQHFVRSILGDEYVDMTEDNIQRGDPFGVYKNQNEFGMFVNIASNNIQVSILAYSLGIVLGIGTLYILFTNGIMLGTFEHMFFAKGLGWKSILVVWIHGTLEISAIVMAGTAGMILGLSILFPGTRSRRDALKQGAKDSVKIIVGLLPFFIAAAFMEGFITRHTGMPVILSISILSFSALLIIWYFSWYPMLLKRSGLELLNGKPYFPNSNS